MDSPILQDALAHAPETIVNHEELYRTSSGINYLFWAEDSDLAAFKDGLTADPTVTNVSQLAETSTGRMYRVTFTDYGERIATFPFWSGLDISLLDLTGSHKGWDVRMRMSDRDTLHQFRKVCEENDLQFHLTSIYEENKATSKAEARLTTVQREALTTARELGYFEIPRQASLADVADQLGVSSQALSERLRRGTTTLIDTVL
ncbi:helix-turn-helix domain-containing protein [Halalkalicoccus sp. GCM10025704]